MTVPKATGDLKAGLGPRPSVADDGVTVSTNRDGSSAGRFSNDGEFRNQKRLRVQTSFRQGIPAATGVGFWRCLNVAICNTQVYDVSVRKLDSRKVS
ncbi:hypothetical protein L1987_69251 [Smallanthus sonchifolius]|uniref:Uncharacterized protein n=1 Tax=Smallanthus sonchifolius TaxID=185202 RepID=A0ACB9B657_9ASTR|nr:hypothetical protein L1987_69251 [Smallanthus sonchifolius]